MDDGWWWHQHQVKIQIGRLLIDAGVVKGLSYINPKRSLREGRYRGIYLLSLGCLEQSTQPSKMSLLITARLSY